MNQRKTRYLTHISYIFLLMLLISNTASCDLPANKSTNKNNITFNGQHLTIEQNGLLEGGVYINGDKILKTGDREYIKNYFSWDGNLLVFMHSYTPAGYINNTVVVIKNNGNVIFRQDFVMNYWHPKIYDYAPGRIEFILTSVSGLKEKYFIYSINDNKLVNYKTQLLHPLARTVKIIYNGQSFYVNGKIKEDYSNGLKNYILIMPHKKVFYGSSYSICEGSRYYTEKLNIYPSPKNIRTLIKNVNSKFLVTFKCPMSGIEINSIRYIK
jgi:hypothetical protein